MKNSHEKNGFTLIELLVVISIIALLLAIIMPALGFAKRQAQGSVCLANVSGLSKAWYLYTTDNDDRLVGAATRFAASADFDCWVACPQTDTGTTLENWKTQPTTVEEKWNGIRAGLLYPYIMAEKAYHCPGDNRSQKTIGPEAVAAGAAPGSMGGYRTYSLPYGLNGRFSKAHRKLTTIKSPGDKYSFIEEADGRGWNVGEWALSKTGDTWTDPIAIWHNDKSSLGYCDGHAEKHIWVDPDTIEMAVRQTPWMTDPGSLDLEYMQRHYPMLD